MRIFLTGATGYIGSAVLDALVRGGHDVTALVRNNEKARGVAKRGGHPAIGDLADPESYRAADSHDGYVHTAFDARSGRGAAIDRLVIDTILDAAAAHGRLQGTSAPLRHLHLGRVGARPHPRPGHRRGADQPRRARVVAA